MAAHIGYLQGNRGDVSRLGSKTSGVRAVAQGWRIGGEVYSGTGNEGGEYVILSINTGSGHGSVPYFALVIDDGDSARVVASKLRAEADRLEKTR